MRVGLFIIFLLIGCIQFPSENNNNPESNSTALNKAPAKTFDNSELQKHLSLEPRLLWKYLTNGNIYGVALSENAEYSILGSWDGSVYCLNKKGDFIWKFKANGKIQDVAMSPNNVSIAVLSYTFDKITLYNLDINGQELWNLSLKGFSRGVDITDDNHIAIASNTGEIFLLNEKEVIWTYLLEKSAWCAWDVVFANNTIIVGDDNGIIYKLSMGGEVLWKEKLGPRDYIYGVSANRNGSLIAASTEDKNIYLFNDGNLKWKRETEFSNYGVAISPKNDLVAVGSWDKNLYIFDIQGNLLWKYFVADNVNRVVFSKNGRFLLIGSSNNHAYLFELE
tara:strand:+ start:2186 stop:3193 length:1008 start_codon:yes stop_codon:yes gene_type:complete